jgi:diacylglycerol O-acyltransferase / wax synthase
MSRLTPLELAFLALESPSRPMHAGAVMLFDPPEDGDSAGFVEQVVTGFRHTQPAGRPWNVRPLLGLASVPSWEAVSHVELEYHVRRVALPPPGSTDQLIELVSFLYPALLDRSRPLWEAYVIEGLKGGGMAVFLKVHHALADGVSGIRMFHDSLSETPNDDPRPLWAVASHSEPPRSRDGRSVHSAVGRLATLAGVPSQIAKLGPQALRLTLRGTAPPFTAAKTPTMAQPISPARSFAMLDLPLAEVKAVGKAFGATVNDVVLSVFDDAFGRYLARSGGAGAGRMVAVVAMSTRREGDASANAVTASLVALGSPDVSPAERLAQVVTGTRRVKSEIRRASPLPLQLQMLWILGAQELRERLPIARGIVPLLANFTLSNISGGPQRCLYLGRARLAGLYITPIAPPAQVANVTLLSYQESLCVGIGAARNIVPDTAEVARLATASFEELAESARPSAAA